MPPRALFPTRPFAGSRSLFRRPQHEVHSLIRTAPEHSRARGCLGRIHQRLGPVSSGAGWPGRTLASRAFASSAVLVTTAAMIASQSVTGQEAERMPRACNSRRSVMGHGRVMTGQSDHAPITSLSTFRFVEPAGLAVVNPCACTVRRRKNLLQLLSACFSHRGEKICGPPRRVGQPGTVRADMRSIVSDEARTHIFVVPAGIRTI